MSMHLAINPCVHHWMKCLSGIQNKKHADPELTHTASFECRPKRKSDLYITCGLYSHRRRKRRGRGGGGGREAPNNFGGGAKYPLPPPS